ncbi:MAG: carbonic anhydrase [Gammaproteobacteria bacterium]|nr:MAG: carbonic anhydrase [Gammaproteobacteria bacterium]RKZ96231.1 MAG: carbonic anhydrase [Gammaproteobacteria bacterium]RKZ98326.1 MAG: carbonic anhydrase [Gammaproteobacteria bacterium]
MASKEKLIDGFQRFKQHYFGNDGRLYASLKNGQPAKTLMVACCDSRVDPAILTDCDPGDLFTIRNVANLVPPCEHDNSHHGTSAALEFAVNNLEVENIIIMGHGNCGGIKALWEGVDNSQTQFIHSWVSMAQPAKDWVKHTLSTASEEEQIKACEQRAVLESLANLMTFSWIRQRVEQGTLSLYGWYFDIAAGELLCFNHTTGAFEIVVD